MSVQLTKKMKRTKNVAERRFNVVYCAVLLFFMKLLLNKFRR